MDHFEEKVQALLNSPDGVAQILNVARSLTGGAEKSPAPEDASPAKSAPDVPAVSASSAPGDDILSVLGQVDPAVIQSVMGLVREYQSTDDRRFHLLEALRPYIKSADAPHIDKAIQIMRLSRVIRRVFSSNSGGGNLV